MKALLISVLLVGLVGCAKTPPNLTPEANVAFKATQAVKALDLLRDTAITANAQTPPLLSEDDTRKVVQYHQSSVKIIQTSPGGWMPAVNQGLDEVLNNLKPGDRAMFSPYVTLIKTLIAEVTR